MDLMLKGDNLDKLVLLEHLSSTANLLADLQHNETAIRKSLILKNVSPTARETLKDTVANAWLFGGGLDEKVKASKVLQRSAQELRPTAKPSKNRDNKNPKNFKSPPRRFRYKATSQATANGQKSTYKPRDTGSYYRNRSSYQKNQPDRRRRK
ncbi:uncharacterized protein LOC113464355 [Ceratina calcarata]|uniref:Uncharacterized protein LOC113464355 n=1 Tax=Ceratina calcarata TaxID=156304 RepID=A0AAJ7S272_9HYME|nr:uncharacterized protein LOC113464355 [Ceratina calcarata]